VSQTKLKQPLALNQGEGLCPHLAGERVRTARYDAPSHCPRGYGNGFGCRAATSRSSSSLITQVILEFCRERGDGLCRVFVPHATAIYS